jgi:hypothetical protein
MSCPWSLRLDAAAQATSTTTLVGLVTTSKTAERFCDRATIASICLRRAGVDLVPNGDPLEPVADVAIDTEDALMSICPRWSQ